MPLGYEHLTSVPRVISDRAKVDQARNKVGQMALVSSWSCKDEHRAKGSFLLELVPWSKTTLSGLGETDTAPVTIKDSLSLYYVRRHMRPIVLCY